MNRLSFNNLIIRGCLRAAFLLQIALYSTYRYLFLANARRKKISFCTTVMNRRAHIFQTLPENLKNNRAFEKEIEFVLVNFMNSAEGVKTDREIRSRFRRDIENGYLKYLITDKMRFFSAPKAKNTSHLNASGLYLFNLDADNYITLKEVDLLLKNYVFGRVAHFFSKRNRDGSYGRIGMGAYEFAKLGGYREALRPMVGQDYCLVQLCREVLGVKIQEKPPAKMAIQHSFKERLINTEYRGFVPDEESAKSIVQRLNIKSENFYRNNLYHFFFVKQKKPKGVEVVEITMDNIDTFFYSFPDSEA